MEDFSGSVLVIIDSLKAITEADENSSEIEKTLKMLKRISEKANCCILIAHHKGKSKDAKQSGRGHSSIYDSLDVQMDIDSKNDKFILRCSKMRDGKFFDGIEYVMTDKGRFVEAQNCTSELHFDIINDKVITAGDGQRLKLLKILSKKQSLVNNRDLYNEVKGDKTSYVKVINSLLEENLIEESKGIKNSRMFKITVKGLAGLAFSLDQ